jgi:hypothetical protein
MIPCSSQQCGITMAAVSPCDHTSQMRWAFQAELSRRSRNLFFKWAYQPCADVLASVRSDPHTESCDLLVWTSGWLLLHAMIAAVG